MRYLIVPFLFIFFNSNAQSVKPDQTIESDFQFELQEYLGTWYEIARFDHPFERNLQGVTATYTIHKNGKIKVINAGYKGGLNGKFKKATGKAKPASPDSPRRLKVSFFWFFYSPYNILELDEDYSYALIGSGSDEYLWILSRTPKMEKATYEMLLQKATERGYDIKNLQLVEQPTN